MVLLDKIDIEIIARKRLSDDGVIMSPDQFRRIINCIWREINEKQKIRPFTTELAANTRIRTLAKIFHKLQECL